MEGEHTPTIIRLILLMILALIQLKDLLFNSSFSEENLHSWASKVSNERKFFLKSRIWRMFLGAWTYPSNILIPNLFAW